MKRWSFTAQQVQVLQERYADCDTRDLAAELGVTVKALVAKAWSLGLKRSKAAMSQAHTRPNSCMGQTRRLLVAADARGLRAADVAELVSIHPAIAQKTLSNLALRGQAWCVRRRRGESRWYAALELAEQARASLNGDHAVPLPPRPTLRPSAPALPAAAPAPAVTPATRYVVAPPIPDRYAVSVPAEGGFSSRRPGDYPLPASGWVSAVTRQA